MLRKYLAVLAVSVAALAFSATTLHTGSGGVKYTASPASIVTNQSTISDDPGGDVG